jgi:hypothetical protein
MCYYVAWRFTSWCYPSAALRSGLRPRLYAEAGPQMG